MPVKLSLSTIRVERLSRTHEKSLGGFSSYEKDLIDFLREDALPNEEAFISTTHLWFHRESGKLMGYITLLADALNLTAPLKEDFRKAGIKYKSLPALKIGRLCVDDRFLRLGIGTLMLKFAVYLAAESVEKFGCRFITVEAKRNAEATKDSIHFYKRNDFKILREREKGTTPMYKDISKIIAGFRSQPQT